MRIERVVVVAALMCVPWSPAGSAPDLSGPESAAYLLHVETPHWQWENKNAQGTVRAIFLVNNLAMREPYELAQRFDIDATVIQVQGDAYRNKFDEDALADALKQNPDVLVVAAKYPWRDLSEGAQTRISDAVNNGLALVCFGRGREFGPSWASWTDRKARRVDFGVLADGLPIDAFPWRGRPEARKLKVGAGSVLLIANYGTHFTFFNAFLPRAVPLFGSSVPSEVAYALAARLIRYGAGKQSSHSLKGALSVDPKLKAGVPSVIRISPKGLLSVGATLAWTLHSSFGDEVQKGHADWDEDKKEFSVQITPQYAGKLVCRLRLSGPNDLVLSTGLFNVNIAGSYSPVNLDVPETLKSGAPLKLTWTPGVEAPPKMSVHARVIDPDGRVVSAATVSAGSGSMSLPGWSPRYVTHSLQILLLLNGNVLDERRQDVLVRIDRAPDLTEMQVPLWGTEQGAWPEQWRYALLRGLGITALAPIGIRPDVVRMASGAGLRIVPTNILYPVEDEKQNLLRQQRLREYAPLLAKYVPLGYSLADEPKGRDLREWRQLGADIIHSHDPGARIGYCGTWSTDPDLYEVCDFVTPYSPHHLYTPDLWLGVERDIYRAIRRSDGILTCWTHYAPWRDHEPYSRTVPWLWLFEEMNGVSYFQSCSKFGVLPSDLVPTHETRWWSEELNELHRGTAAQIIGMRRDRGQVRILHRPGSLGAASWARALNRANVPYRFLPVAKLADGIPDTIRLLLCPDVPDLTAAAMSAVKQAASRGCHVIATAGFASMVDGEPAGADRLVEVFGILRDNARGADDLRKTKETYGGVPTTVEWDGFPGLLKGKTIGEAGIVCQGAEMVATFDQLGVATRSARATAPGFVKRLFDTPAATLRRHGTGRAIYMTFYPDLNAVSAMLPVLLKDAGVDRPQEQIQVSGLKPGQVYLYPFSRGGVRLIGVVADYWRIGPAWQLNGDESKQTAAHFLHGPLRWARRTAALNLSKEVYTYDVRRGRYLGKKKSITFKLDPTRPALFALLPYRVQGLTLKAPASTRQGRIVPVRVQLQTMDAPSGDHVIHVELIGPSGESLPADRYNVWAKGGEAVLDVPIPFNATPGAWRILARDVLTGVASEKTVQVGKGETVLHHWRPRKSLQTERVPRDWPQGKWQPYENPAESVDAVRVSASQVRAANIRGLAYVRGGFTLKNELVTYTLKYLACNDPKETRDKTGARIKAPYPPGFGFTKPRPHMWYYNGYLRVSLDDFRATVFAVTNIIEIASGQNGRVDLSWDTPVASFRLATVMMPDHLGLFQELSIKPRQHFGKLKVGLASYPAGFSKDPVLKVVEQEHGSWVLLGNKVKDRAYGQGLGPGGLLVLPEQWKSVSFGRSASLVKVVDRKIAASGNGLTAAGVILAPGEIGMDSDAGGSDDDLIDLGFDLDPDEPPEVPLLPEIRVHWVLWIFPELANDDALRYMQESSEGTKRRLIELFDVQRTSAGM